LGSGTATASYRNRRSVERLLGVLAARSEFAAPSPSRDEGSDLFGFLNRLEAGIPDCGFPEGRRVLALIDHRSKAPHDTTDWVASHPGWSCLRLSHREWRREVEHLFSRCTSRSARHIRSVLRLMDGREPFDWLKTERERPR
jgi:hypothetical protein